MIILKEWLYKFLNKNIMKPTYQQPHNIRPEIVKATRVGPGHVKVAGLSRKLYVTRGKVKTA